MMNPKVLIVGTVPYNNKSTSRALESYFSHWERMNLAQVFSNTKQPAKGHCKTLYQITDQRMITRRLSKNVETGAIYNYDELHDECDDHSLEPSNPLFSKLYEWGKKKSPLTYIIRGFIWKRKYWCTNKLNQWLDEFGPECIFLCFSDDFFIPQIALYIAERYNIPIVSSIGDDYFFNVHFSLSPFYYIYKFAYRQLIRKVLSHPGSAIYICDKIRDKYNVEFGLNGETVYLASSIKRHEFREIDVQSPMISYCGNIRLGRNESLNDIGYALGKINPMYMLDVYSNEEDERYFGIYKKNLNIRYHGSVPYSEVKKVLLESDIVIVVEGFSGKDVIKTRYSLSTKVADSLASGANIFGYGSSDCGAIEYLQITGCCIVCTQKHELSTAITRLIHNRELQRRNYERSKQITEINHNINRSTEIFERIVRQMVKK